MEQLTARAQDTGPESAPAPVPADALKQFGIDYLFPYQRLVISNILEAGKDLEHLQLGKNSSAGDIADSAAKQIVILPTGAGKSLCFMLPALLLEGPTLVVFPLLSLIADQLRRCREADLPAAALTGGQDQKDRSRIFRELSSGSLRIVLTNPETALSPAVLPKLKDCGFSHLVLDEVHTVSEWGDTFRPAYLDSARIHTETGIPIVTAFTATASEKVLKRVKEVLFPGESPRIVSSNPDRTNIAYTVLPSLCRINSLRLLLAGQDSPGTAPKPYPPSSLVRRPALVFCGTRKTAEITALQLRLRLNEPDIFFYHAGLSREEKAEIEKWFFSSDNGILCATTAYGMGVDKANIRTVIHHDLSPSVEAYLQESGRAGRDRDPAEAILLYSPEAALRSGDPRYRSLLAFAEDSGTCRRNSLLGLLGAEPVYCQGCDVCRGRVELLAPWEDSFIRFVRMNRRTVTRSGAVKQLAAAAELLTEEDAQEIIGSLLSAGKIRQYRNGPWKGMLWV